MVTKNLVHCIWSHSREKLHELKARAPKMCLGLISGKFFVLRGAKHWTTIWSKWRNGTKRKLFKETKKTFEMSTNIFLCQEFVPRYFRAPRTDLQREPVGRHGALEPPPPGINTLKLFCRSRQDQQFQLAWIAWFHVLLCLPAYTSKHSVLDLFQFVSIR